MKEPRISILIPVVRPEKAQRCIEAIRADGFAGEIWAEEDIERIGCPKMLDKLVQKSTGDLVCFLGDDTVPQPRFMQEALKAMETLPDGWGVVGLNSQKSRHAAHFLADKRMLDLLPDRQFFNTAYHHCFGDNELTDLAKACGRFVFCDAAVVVHDHPIFTGDQFDEGYTRAYRPDMWQHDHATYYRRKRERLNGGMAIGFPLVANTVPSSFFLSFVSMDKPDNFSLFVPTNPHGEFPKSIAAARCAIVEQAQDAGCTWLFMMDTDQTYPQDTLTKLYSHQKDVCGVLVHRGWRPFNPILLRGEFFKLSRVPDEECYSGKLIEIDATGTGCLLIKMEVFDDLWQPYFEETTFEGEPVGEDINFCSKVRKSGRQIFADTSIQVGHLRLINIDRMYYEIFTKLNGLKKAE